MSPPCQRCADFPTRVAEWVTRNGYDRSPSPSDRSEITGFHTALRCLGWRSTYPQEGGEYLYNCRRCNRWWGLLIWTCVNHVDLIDYPDLVSVEAWMKEQPISGREA